MHAHVLNIGRSMLRPYSKRYDEGVQMIGVSAVVGSMVGSRRGRRLLAAWGVMIGIAVFFGGDVRREIASTNHGDMLAYVTQDYRLMLYDPRTRTETELMTGVEDFRLSRDGRVAFKNTDENDHDVYVYDPATPDVAPINISQDTLLKNSPLSWSPDGRYLAFAAYLDSFGDQLLYVWDGERAIRVKPENPLHTADRFYLSWSQDGKLAFTVQHGWLSDDVPPEVYIWDGRRTFNLSQNPAEWDGGAKWSSDGKVMFASLSAVETGVYDWYVWDGVSFADGLPDRDSFSQVASGLGITSAEWLPDGQIAVLISASIYSTGEPEYVQWDVESETIVERFPVSRGWLGDEGRLMFSALLRNGLPSYHLEVKTIGNRKTLLRTAVGEFGWSTDGYLAYCIPTGRAQWRLAVWDGNGTRTVSRASYRPVQWQYGGTVASYAQDTFSCNNG